MTKKNARSLTDTRFAALDTIAKKGSVPWPQIEGHEDGEAVVTRTYADLVRLGLIENHNGYSHRMTDAGKNAHRIGHLERFQKLPHEVFLLSEDYGPSEIATAYESFDKLKTAAEEAIRKAAVEYFKSQDPFGAGDQKAIEKKIASIVAKAKKASTTDAIEQVAEAVLHVDSDNWYHGAKITIDRVPLLRG